MSDLDTAAAWAGLNHGDTSKMGVLASAGVAGSHGIHCAQSTHPGRVAWYGQLEGEPSQLQLKID